VNGIAMQEEANAMTRQAAAGDPLTLGFSPCPNDTFIFCALAEARIDPRPHGFQIITADVELLNQHARQHALDISKVSINALAHFLDEYWLLRAGAALGRGCGPLVVAREPLTMADLRNQPLAIPGRLTTATLLLGIHGEHRGPRLEMPFEQILPAVSQGEVRAGVIIHEGRFTYSALGLHLVLDLGEWWEEHTGLPLPLGGIVMRRSLGPALAQFVETKIRESLSYARRHPREVWPYITAHAQEMEPAIIRRHIDTFVNDFTVDLGPEGENAVRVLVEAACQQVGLPSPEPSLFWTD
jgi:1,4-dihydroxy-6-naphthoate synthase